MQQINVDTDLKGTVKRLHKDLKQHFDENEQTEGLFEEIAQENYMVDIVELTERKL